MHPTLFTAPTRDESMNWPITNHKGFKKNYRANFSQFDIKLVKLVTDIFSVMKLLILTCQTSRPGFLVECHAFRWTRDMSLTQVSRQTAEPAHCPDD